MSVCKVIAGSLTEREGEEGGGGKKARAVGGEIGRRRMERTRTKYMKSRKIRMARVGWGGRERGKESVSAGSLPLLAPLAGSCCWWLQKSARQSRSLLLAIRDHSSGCLLAGLQIPQKYPLITTVGHRLFTKWIWSCWEWGLIMPSFVQAREGAMSFEF